MSLRAAKDPDSITALRFIKALAVLWQNASITASWQKLSVHIHLFLLWKQGEENDWEEVEITALY